MLKARTGEQREAHLNGRLLVEAKLTLAVQATSLEYADMVIDALFQALASGDFEELKKLREVVSPESWRTWVAYDTE